MRAPLLLATLALLPTLIQAGAATSSPEQVHVGDSLKRLDLLRPGVHRYVRYTIKDGRRSLIDIWSRTVSFEPHEGRRLLHIVQRWDEVSDKDPFFLIQDSWFEPNTFRPLTHIRRRSKDGKETVSAYQFLPDKVIGLPGVPDNTRNDFVVASPEASYNF